MGKAVEAGPGEQSSISDEQSAPLADREYLRPAPGDGSPLLTASPATRVGQAKNSFGRGRLMHPFREFIQLPKEGPSAVKAVRQLRESGLLSSVSGFSTSLGRFSCFYCLRRNSSRCARAARSSLVTEFRRFRL
jgi:hypothetical protein